MLPATFPSLVVSLVGLPITAAELIDANLPVYGALLDWAFGTLDLNRVQAETDTRNLASARVLEKLGFQREGTLREDCIVDGVVSDSWVFGLLRRDRRA